MVRSVASPSSSDSDMLQSSLDTHSETGSQEAARIDADEQEALRRRGNFKIWYRRRLTIIIFELALEKAFQQECSSSRQVAGKLSSFRRRCQGHDTEGIMYLALPQLNSEVGASARRDYELLQSLYEAPMPPNDETWIYSAMVGRHQDPGRQQVEHRLQLLLLRSLGARLQTSTPEFLYRALLNASGGLYRDFLWVVWPLLTDEDRRDFQQWYYSGSDEPPARPTDETAALRMAVEEHEEDPVHVVLLQAPLKDVHKMLSAFPQMRHSFQHEVDQLESSAPVSLQAFWAAKNHLRACQRCAASYVEWLRTYFSDLFQEARKEFDLFGAYMKKPEESQSSQPEGLSQRSSTAGSATTAKETEEALNMEVDRDKRQAEPARETPEDPQPPPKFAKGEAKGAGQDSKPEEAPTGKGRSAESSQPAVAPAAPADTKTRDQGRKPQTGSWDGGNRQGQQQSWRRTGGYQQWPARRRDGGQGDRNEGRDAKELRELKEVVKAMGRLSLRTEDALGAIHLDLEYILFLQTEASGNEFAITQRLYNTAVQWNKQKEEQPESLTNPMRNILLYNLFTALLSQLESLEEDRTLMEKAKAKGLIEGTTYLYLQWDHASRSHVKASVQPLEHQEAVLAVKTLRYLATFPNVVARFHALRRMSEVSMGGDIIPFSLVVQNRTQESHQMWTLMSRLARNSIWHLVGGTARPAKMGRSPLARQLDRLVQAL
ncbi:hypothetical protein AK812_SmicGene14373 [Symbiodinium microadriaticum]|uniref:Uncharacterized protein n=1 Tax=Symbiodinium microadriaticum TaxID=2951 RepID=A0A1Q9E5N4_SYMMI|nr:hypothetical protein AK812_SmicGene14373 [Symbiodinium microadriaticum]